MNSLHPRILVVRNDKLGDFMLAWPALALLRANMPGARISVLVPGYTAPLAEICPSVDDVLVDLKLPGELRSARMLARLMKQKEFSAVITLFSRFDTGLAAWLAGIPYRLAPATKLAQIFYNRHLVQRRSESAKPEYEYNADLVRRFLSDNGIKDIKPVAPPYLQFDEMDIRELKRKFRETHGIPGTHKLVFIHPGHGGSANNLSLIQYAALARNLYSRLGHHVVLTAGPGEERQVRELSALLAGVPHCSYFSHSGLVQFAQYLQMSDVFISGSTGPLHLAAALNRCTAAFYPRRRSSTALRWQTMNDPHRRLAFAPPLEAGEDDMAAIDAVQCAGEISSHFLQ
ncbi:MAG TPA: glycosyltransferase family 9 protein [Gammaproteobacteria bacterium]|nr:glycosyltransferase family 9 protein [Gammaproteobacteria bacterium]